MSYFINQIFIQKCIIDGHNIFHVTVLRNWVPIYSFDVLLVFVRLFFEVQEIYSTPSKPLR